MDKSGINYTATYSPDDNKLRLYASSRLDAETYARVKAAGFKWAPQQGLFVAPIWTPSREDLLIELAGEIGDEDTSLTERAEDRAERFDGYSEKRAQDANQAREAVSAIADNIPLGQPILVGHHSERHARRDAEKIENGIRRAVKMWETSKYWERRAAGAIAHAKYKERPDVRARRIKTIEADARKLDRADKESADTLKAWALVDQPEKWKARENGERPTREERAAYIAGRMSTNYVKRREDGIGYWSAYDLLRLPAEERYQGVPVMTVDEVLSAIRKSCERETARRARWRAHYNNRLAYERAMLAESGGILADQVKPEVGGAVRSLFAPRGGWSYIVKVNRVTVTIRHQWSDGGRVFRHNEPLDKIRDIMTRAQVEEAREQGRIQESPEGLGFWLMQSREELDAAQAKKETPKPEQKENAEEFAAMKESLKAGVQVVTAPQLFPTPIAIAEKMAELAEIEPGHRVLEPSAGTGNILKAIQDTGKNCEVIAVEINNALCRGLNTNPCVSKVEEADFLQCCDLGTFDRILMNPPFANAADIQHIEHALTKLKPGGRIVAICANGPRQNERLKPRATTWEPLPPGSFKESGTGVNAVLLTIDA